MEGLVTEAGKIESSFGELSFEAKRPLTMLDLARSFEKAAKDDAVKAVVIDADDAGLDLSQIQEIRRHLLEIKKAGKDVWMYTEHLSNGKALLGSAANHFTLMPETDCSFSGIYAESLYFKGMLDKIGVRADVIHIGDFKSFGEEFYRTGPSEYAAKQKDQLIDSIYGQLVELIATGRKVSEAKVKAAIDDGGLTAQKFVDAGLADHLLYRTDFVKKLDETYGKDADFDRSYELPDLDGPEITGIMDIFKVMFNEANKGKARQDFVAVVALDGDITDESISPVRTQILKLAKNDRAKALVLRVNSPGGSAMASEVLWEATDEWNATGKPFVVSMGGVAASGGYYVSSSAKRIFAEAGTITGSIGVVGMKLVVGEAFEKMGITTHATQRGENAGVMSMTRGFSEDEAKIVRDSMTEVYKTFKKRVSDGRGKALKGDLESLAGGRIYSGKDALENGLVDEIGGLNEAIAWVTKDAKLENPDVKLVPEPKSGIEGLFAPKERKNDDEVIRATTTPSHAVNLQAMLQATGLLGALPPSVKSQVARFAGRLEAFQHTQVLLLGPDIDLK
ncbi:MAG: signal peptide peptidase SppA [Akkermansiaceae bacterium]|nr:signal peptide peptidase SppA [Akkermansiaceae bacterium]